MHTIIVRKQYKLVHLPPTSARRRDRFTVTPGVDEFLLLACDGVWEMMDTTQGRIHYTLYFEVHDKTKDRRCFRWGWASEEASALKSRR